MTVGCRQYLAQADNLLMQGAAGRRLGLNFLIRTASHRVPLSFTASFHTMDAVVLNKACGDFRKNLVTKEGI